MDEHPEDPQAQLPGSPAPPSRKARKPRKDGGTKRVSLSATLVKDLEGWAKLSDHNLEGLLGLWARQAGEDRRGERITLPLAVLARLKPAAKESGQTVSELLADLEPALVDLLDGKLLREHPGGGDPVAIPPLVDMMVDAYRARLLAAKGGD